MRLSLDWIADWIPLPGDAELVERLSLGGFEDVAIHASGPDLSGLRVGCVVERGAHPNADRLSLCRVDVGSGELLPIVCGAPNVAAGQKVAVALPGTVLPDGTKLKKSKLRGVESQGMICSQRELGLGDAHEGIWVLPADARVGAPLPEVVKVGRRVLEVGLTPNRGDAASVLGVAREIRAFFGGVLALPPSDPREEGADASAEISIRIDADERCHSYVGRIVRGVRVGPSPAWLVERLEAAGLRSIHNVVDLTNLVMLEFGQPLHAFDLAALRGSEVIVRCARAGEGITTLDGVARTLAPEDLVIADRERAVAIAGVMGGRDSEVRESTRDILIESAHFEPIGIRMSARRHALHSEASYRFERGVDRDGVARAADRAARLIAEIAGGRVARGRVVARGVAPPALPSIRLAPERLNRLLGTALAPTEVESLLARVGVATRWDGDALVATPPSHRNDLAIPEDLVEEVARIHGYERIPTTLPIAPLGQPEEPPLWSQAERARDALAAAGLFEVVSFPFVSRGALGSLGLPSTEPRARSLALSNPIHEGEAELRTHLLPSLLALAVQNLNRQAEEVAIFEIARVFVPQGESELPSESLQLVALLAGAPRARLWANAAPLFFRAKGIAERLLFELGYVAWFQVGDAPQYLHPAESLRIGAAKEGEAAKRAGAAPALGEAPGFVGTLHPDVAARFDLGVPCALVEVSLPALARLPRRSEQVREVSRQPGVRRDIAIRVSREQRAEEIAKAIRRSAGAHAVSVELFDRYEGKGVGAGQVSLAFRLFFQHPERTLTDAEVSASMDRVVKTLAERFGAEQR
jgi:phenylalanyl-tRNA synthetase beta chain